MTYVVVSDIHAHANSVFSKTNADGVNSRLRIITNELMRAAAVLKERGGDLMVIAGDIFHTRGTIDPEVLNPLQETIAKIMDSGVTIWAIPGNHDLKSNDTIALSSQVETLAQTHSDNGCIFEVFNEPTIRDIEGRQLAFVPWRSTIAEVLEDLRLLADECANPAETDVIIHAGIDGAVVGMPDHGLTAEKLAEFGFRHVFAGHYHNHKDMGHGVYSIGATTHQSWRDVGTKAGFLIVEDDGTVIFQDTHAPKFVDVSGMDEDELALSCDGNYVRFRGAPMASDDIEKLRKFLIDSGAKGVMIDVPKTVVSARTAAPATGRTLDQSVQAFVDEKKDLPAHIDRDALKRRVAETLARAREVSVDA